MSRGPNAGHIIVKGDSQKGRPAKTPTFSTKKFFGPIDKGSAKPAFCYPQKRQRFEEEVNTLEKALKSGMVNESRELEVKHRLEKHKKRLDQIDESFSNAKKIIGKDVKGWQNYRNELSERISAGMPSRKDVKDRRVNPFSNLRREKSEGLEQLKKDYIVTSRALTAATGEHHESNVGFLQKDS